MNQRLSVSPFRTSDSLARDVHHFTRLHASVAQVTRARYQTVCAVDGLQSLM
jgi:hypothetical protein